MISEPRSLDEMDISIEYDETPRSFEHDSPVPAELQNVLYPPTKDEQIVNTALVNFPDALTIHFGISSSWTLHRKAFLATFGDTRFEARTDGYLDDSHGSPSVIIEVKPVLRERKKIPIRVQESAQMVAWIKTDDDIPAGCDRTRIIVSQDRHEIFLTVAVYDQKYLDYLRNGSNTLSFLTMHQYGPWDTQRSDHMRLLGPILLAITLRADDEIRKIHDAKRKRLFNPS